MEDGSEASRDPHREFRIGPAEMPHRKNAAEWVMWGMLLPLRAMVRIVGRRVETEVGRRAGRIVESRRALPPPP
jgi:hypothetical protein